MVLRQPTFDRANAHIPIIVLSIFDDDSTKARAMQAGAVAFVAKRGNLEKLLGAVRTSVQYKRDELP
jgi:DNA-binding NarL/FixJ family response regulator